MSPVHFLKALRCKGPLKRFLDISGVCLCLFGGDASILSESMCHMSRSWYPFVIFGSITDILLRC